MFNLPVLPASDASRDHDRWGARTIVIGDVHGCLDELDELLRVAEVRPERDRLVFVGDLMDRGPDPVGVVRRVRELKALCVRGNHEDRHLRWASHEAKRRARPTYVNPMRPLSPAALAQHRELRDDDFAWMATLPLELELGSGWVVVHAGYTADRPRSQQKATALMQVRWLGAEGQMLPMADDLQQPVGGTRWAARWKGPESVVYGHDVQSLAEPVLAETAPEVWCCGIDTGCVFGGRLTAIELPSRRIVQVNARQRYATLGESAES